MLSSPPGEAELWRFVQGVRVLLVKFFCAMLPQANLGLSEVQSFLLVLLLACRHSTAIPKLSVRIGRLCGPPRRLQLPSRVPPSWCSPSGFCLNLNVAVTLPMCLPWALMAGHVSDFFTSFLRSSQLIVGLQEALWICLVLLAILCGVSRCLEDGLWVPWLTSEGKVL